MTDYVIGWGLAYLEKTMALISANIMTFETVAVIMIGIFFLELVQELKNH